MNKNHFIPVALGITLAACSASSKNQPETLAGNVPVVEIPSSIPDSAEMNLEIPRVEDAKLQVRSKIQEQAIFAFTEFTVLNDYYEMMKKDNFYGFRYCHDSGQNAGPETQAVEQRLDGLRSSFPWNVDLSLCDSKYPGSFQREEKAACYLTATITALYTRDPALLLATVKEWNQELQNSIQCIADADQQPDFPQVKADVDALLNSLIQQFPSHP